MRAVAEAGWTVYVVEGERDADALAELGLCGTTSPHGAGKWRDEYAESLRGSHVIVVADKDAPGRAHADAVEHSCSGKARSVKVIELPGDDVKDTADFLSAGGTKADLERLADEAPEWSPLRQGDEIPRIVPAREVGTADTDVDDGAQRFSADRGAYVCEWAASRWVRLEFDRLAMDHDDLGAEIVVRSTIPGLERQLYRKRLNLLATRSVAEFAKALKARTKEQDLDWDALLETAIERTIQAHREGDPAILLSEVPPLSPDALYALHLLALRDHSTFLYGRPDHGKTYLAMAILCALQTGRGDLLGLAPMGRFNVLFLDFEGNGEAVLADRARQITGAEAPPITYLDSNGTPIWDEVDRILRVVRDRRIDFLCSDSVGMACGGLPPESSEAALRYGAAVRRIGLGGIHVAHLTKDAVNEDYPFGSQFWQAQARLTWLVKKHQVLGERQFTMALFNKKTNFGAPAAPIGYEVRLGDGGVRFARTDVRDQPELAASLPVSYRMAHALRTGQREMTELVEELGDKPDAVRIAVSRGVKRGDLVMIERKGAKWVALRHREAS